MMITLTVGTLNGKRNNCVFHKIKIKHFVFKTNELTRICLHGDHLSLLYTFTSTLKLSSVVYLMIYNKGSIFNKRSPLQTSSLLIINQVEIEVKRSQVVNKKKMSPQ